jgi:hypothetical protein
LIEDNYGSNIEPTATICAANSGEEGDYAMTITTDSFVGTWKGAHENGLSAFTIDLKKEDGNLTGIWIINGISGNEVKTWKEIVISAPRFEENRILFKPNPAGPPMALELITENEAFFWPVH